MRQQRITIRTRRTGTIGDPLDLRTPTGHSLPY
jgi:hypothetical protein